MVAQPGQSPFQPKTREEVVAAVDSLPPLPAVAFRVVEVAQNPKSSANDLALVVSADPVLSARILRIVNSAAHRRDREISSVQQALVMLGFGRARNIAVASAVAGTYAPDPRNALFRIDSFWRHSLLTAFKASELAEKRRVDPATAFTAGVVHNIGRLAMFHADPAGLDQAVVEAITKDVPLETIEREKLGYDHAEIGGLLAKKWGLPDDIRAAIAGHHAGTATPLTRLIADADAYCIEHGVLPGYVVPEPLANHAVRTPDVQALLDQVDGLIRQIVDAPVVPITQE